MPFLGVRPLTFCTRVLEIFRKAVRMGSFDFFVRQTPEVPGERLLGPRMSGERKQSKYPIYTAFLNI